MTPGVTSEVTIELIRGVEVEGTVVAQGTGTPVEGAQVGVYGPFRPRTSAMTIGAMTDARGRYHYRLPSGETYFYVMGPPDGFTRLSGEGSSRTVTIPDGASQLRGAADRAGGRRDGPRAGARRHGHADRRRDGRRHLRGRACAGRSAGPRPSPTPAASSVCRRACNNTVAVGKPARLLIRLRDGAEHEAAAVPTTDGAVTLKLPVAGEAPRRVEGPRDVAPDELAGVVVDTDGKPIEGAEVDAWTWYPGHEAKTDAKGLFRIGKLDKDRKVEVVVRKPGYTPQLFLTQPTGAARLGDRPGEQDLLRGPGHGPRRQARRRRPDPGQ